MKIINKLLAIALTTLLLSVTYGCSGTLPTQTSSIVDDRPVLVFIFDGDRPDKPVNIFIDNLYMGNALEFKADKRGLKIIAGSHLIKLEYGDRTILEKMVYVGSGSTKTINVSIN